MRYLYIISGVILINILIVFADGNKNDFEPCAAIYCNLKSSDVMGWHWHTAIFNYFYYSNGYGFMEYSQAGGVGKTTSNQNAHRSISISSYINDLEALKTDFKNQYRGGKLYYGAYYRLSIKNRKSQLIAATARQIGNADINYTFWDMIDPNDYWTWWPYPHTYEDWKGEVYNIDEIRCDGVVEFSYEKNGIDVANYVNIATPGNYYVDKHNDWHDCLYDYYGSGYELCPRLQAGEEHETICHAPVRSAMHPLYSNPPSISNFSTYEIDFEYIQLNFKVNDDRSVKSYVLVQVKKTSESNWHVLVDDNNKTWKFRSVDLTDFDGSKNLDYFHIPWSGKYSGGRYPSGGHNFNLKITAIDQGANYSESIFDFSYTIPPLNVDISGPYTLGYNVSGTFTANPSGGSGTYTNYRWWWRNDDDGGVPRKSSMDINNDVGIKYAPPGGTWYILSGQEGNKIISIGKPADFSLKCKVTDSDNNTATDIHSVFINGSLAKAQSAISEISVVSIPEQLELNGNYPNPFNPSTTIKFGLPDDSNVRITIYSISGQEIISLVDGSFSKGYHEIKWNGKNQIGNSVSNGVYLYELKAGNNRLIKKMVFAK